MFDVNYCRGWLGYGLVALLLFVAMFILLTQLINQGRPVDQVKVIAPPSMNTMEQLLAVQNAISQVEELVKNGNIVLLKLRALLFAVPSQVFVFIFFTSNFSFTRYLNVFVVSTSFNMYAIFYRLLLTLLYWHSF